jgi:flagellin
MMALNSHRNLNMVGNQQANASARLSSGFRINSAADDAAGLGISENMRAQIRGLDQASRNSQDAISLIQTAEGGLSTIGDMLGRIRELTVQAANDTNTHGGAATQAGGGGTGSNRSAIQREVNNLIAEIGRTSDTLEFNTRNLLGRDNNTLTFQVGANSGQTISVTMPNVIASVAASLIASLTPMTAWTGNVNEATDMFLGQSVVASITAMIGVVDDQISRIAQARGEMGALQNRLEFTVQNLDVSSENLSAANSRIRDADMAREMMRLTQSNVLQQAAISMLSQGNQAPQNVLQLLR